MRRRGEEEKRRRGECRVRFLVVVIASFSFVVFSGCGPNPSIMNSRGSTQQTPAPAGERPVPTLEKEVEAMRTANFDYIFALRRKDGGKLDVEDKRFIKANAPDSNRYVTLDEDKTVIAGSNFPVAPERLRALRERFNFTDYSATPMPVTNGNTNSNANVNIKK
jgi:hypothetical protein